MNLFLLWQFKQNIKLFDWSLFFVLLYFCYFAKFSFTRHNQDWSTAQIAIAWIAIGQHFFRNCDCSTQEIATAQIGLTGYLNSFCFWEQTNALKHDNCSIIRTFFDNCLNRIKLLQFLCRVVFLSNPNLSTWPPLITICFKV